MDDNIIECNMNKYEKTFMSTPIVRGIIIEAIKKNHNCKEDDAMRFFDSLSEDVRNDIAEAVNFSIKHLENTLDKWKEAARNGVEKIWIDDDFAKKIVCEAICRCGLAKTSWGDALDVYYNYANEKADVMLQTAKVAFEECTLNRVIVSDKESSEIKIEISDNSGDKAAELKQVDKGDTVKERVENVAIMELAKNCIMEEMKCDYGKAEKLLKANPMWARVIINIVRTGKSIFPLKL